MTRKQKPPEIVEAQLYDGEELVWWGQPIPSYMLRRVNVAALLPNLLMIGFAIFFIIFSQSMFADAGFFEPSPSGSSIFGESAFDSRPPAFIRTLFPIFFLIIPLIMMAAAGRDVLAPIFKWSEATSTYYVLTNKRAVIVKDVGTRQVQSFYDEQMKQLTVKMYRGGVGDVIFASDTVGVSSSNSSTTSTKNVDVGFLAVPDARTVEDFLAQIFFNDDADKKKK